MTIRPNNKENIASCQCLGVWVRVIAQGVKGYGLDQGQVLWITWIRVVSQCFGLGFMCLGQCQRLGVLLFGVGIGLQLRCLGFSVLGLGFRWVGVGAQCLGLRVRFEDQGLVLGCMDVFLSNEFIETHKQLMHTNQNK